MSALAGESIVAPSMNANNSADASKILAMFIPQ
jgi:hypothetical protein